jgi:hypothetical protein
MKTLSSTPAVRALVESMAKGENHDSSGLTEVSRASPPYTLISAISANAARVSTSAVSR